MTFNLFKKNRSVEFVLSQTPEENKPVEKTDEDIGKIASDRLALGPAATEQDIQNYSQNQNVNPFNSFGRENNVPASMPNISETANTENESFFPFMPANEDLNNNLPSENHPTNYQEPDQIIKLQRKVDNLIDEINFLKRKIERLE